MKLIVCLRFNLLKRKLVGVHGVAMNPRQAKKFKGLVWCPEANRVLLNKHARIADLKTHTTLVFRNRFHINRKLEYMAPSQAGEIPPSGK